MWVVLAMKKSFDSIDNDKPWRFPLNQKIKRNYTFGKLTLMKSPTFFWRYKVISNKVWRFRQTLVAFSEYLNFTRDKIRL